MTQDKIHLYEMSPPEIEKYGLQGEFDPTLGGFQEDALIHPRSLQLCESKGLGRFAVLICEDFSHLEPAAVTAIKLGAEFLICPVMDGSFEPYRWVPSWADWYARTYRVQSVSINSLVLPSREPSAKPGRPPRRRYKVGVVARSANRRRIQVVRILSSGDPGAAVCRNVRLRGIT
jgi:hypothetical protein